MSIIIREHPRPIRMIPNINPHAAGSVMTEFGHTKVHITANIEESVPRWMKGEGRGWIKAEYSMLPGATHSRSRREREKISGRTYEIQRLLGRSLRSIVDLEKLGERSLLIDCDVLIADGGTRTASLSGAFVAMKMAVQKLMDEGTLKENPITDQLGAISVGINSDQKIIADLNYIEDSTCDTDMNIVMTASGKFIEIQGTAESQPFSGEQLQALLDASRSALQSVFEEQNRILKSS